MKYIMFAALVMFAGCAKPNIVHLKPIDSGKAIEEILEDKELSTDDKVYLISVRMSEELERKKRAVESEKDSRLAAAIQSPVMPLRTPDTILRVLMLPYEDDKGVLNSWKYSFIKVDDGSWVLSDYLNGAAPSSKPILTPLKGE